MKEYTQEQKAIRSFLSKPTPTWGACGCMGPGPLPGQPQCTGDNLSIIKFQPLCYCAMQYVELVDDFYWKVEEFRTVDGITHSATNIGPVGGPYTL